MEKVNHNLSGFWLCITKGTIISLCVVMVSVLLFAFVVKWASLGEEIINPINQIIKIIAVFFGVWACLKKSSTKYLYKGALVGLMFAVLSFLLFSLLNGSFSFDFSIVWDCVFSSAIGVISSVIAKILMK